MKSDGKDKKKYNLGLSIRSHKQGLIRFPKSVDGQYEVWHKLFVKNMLYIIQDIAIRRMI